MARSIDPAIGERIARARQHRGITQAALAKALGVKPQQVSRFEAGKASPTAEQLRTIAETLACSVDALLDLKPSVPRLLHQVRAALDVIEVSTAGPAAARTGDPVGPATPPAS